MPTVNLLIPLRTTSRNGFYNHHGAATKRLFGYRLHMRIAPPYQYLELQGVPSERAPEILKKVRRVLPWAALRLNFGLLGEKGDLQVADHAIFDGQFPTAYDANLIPSPGRTASNHRGEEADTLLFSALIEGSQLAVLTGPSLCKQVLLALEIFASVDFEASDNAQFLALISILEILAKPAPRRKECIDIIDDAVARATREAEATQDRVLQQALTDMRKAASHWKKESIRSSIRRLAISVSQTLGDPDPEAAWKLAVRLYDKRSDVVHGGDTASSHEALQSRQIAREALAVKVGCFHHIRERYPTN